MLIHFLHRWPMADPVEKLLWLYVLVTPLMVVPLRISRVQPAEIVFLVAGGWFFWELLRQRRRFKISHIPFEVCVGLYVLVSIVALMNSPVPSRSLIEVAIILYLASFYFLFTNVIQSRDGLWALVEVWLVATVLVVLTGFVGIGLVSMGINTRIAQGVSLGGTLPFLIPRVYSTMITAKLLSTYLVVGLPLAIARLQAEDRPKVRRLILLLIAAMSLTLIFTFSREWVSAMVAMLVLWFTASSGFTPKYLRLAFLAGVVVFFLVIQLISAFHVLNVANDTSRLPGASINPRITDAYDPKAGVHHWQLSVNYIWTDYLTLKWVAWSMLREHPWIGGGVGTFSAYLNRRIEEGSVFHGIGRYEVPHSTIFGKAGETGLLGLGVLIALFGTWITRIMNTIRHKAKGSDRWLAAAFLAGVVGLLTNSLNIDLMNFRYLWTVLGMGMAAHTILLRASIGAKGVQ